MEFGNTTNSQILAVGTSTARSWALDKSSDVKGNYYTVTYTNDTTNGQYYPTRIDYTANTGAGLTPYNSVQFFYNTSRPDVTPVYEAGSLIQTTVLLTDVKTYQGSNLVLDYRLQYQPGSALTHSRLTSVTLCDGNSNCLAPTTFGWQGGTGTLSATATSTSSLVGAVFGDFNGDGLTDALLPPTTTTCGASNSIQASLTLMLGTNSGSFNQTQVTATYGGSGTPGGPTCTQGPGTPVIAGVLDFDGNGVADILLTQTYSSFVYIHPFGYEPGYAVYALKNTGQGNLVETSMVTGGAGSNTPNLTVDGNVGAPPLPTFVTQDWNGDGLDDMMGYISNGDGTFTTNLASALPTGTTSAFAADFDGHGCTGILTQGSSNQITNFCNSALSGINTAHWTGQIVTGDFNGDGMDDVLVVPPSGSGTLFLSTGTGLSATNFAVPSSWDGCQIVAGDFDGNGKVDIAVNCGGTISVYLSTGTGFVLAASLSNSAASGAAAVDLNSDGAKDLFVGATSYIFAYSPELMTTVSNGIGATTTISYDRINKNGSFYTKGTGATYPTQDMDGAYYVVSRVDTSNGIGGTYSATYAYAGGKLDLKGRGFLGYSTVTTTDLQTTVVTTTNYRTDFPYAGVVLSQTKTVGGTTLSSVTNAYTDSSAGTGTDGVVRHSVLLTQSIVTGSDLDGTALPTTTTNYSNYDSYGNAGTVNVSVSDGSSKNSTNTFTNDTGNWFLGRLTSSVVTSTVGSSVITRTSCFQYDSGTGLLTREVIEPVSPSNCSYSAIGVQTDYSYDAFGHRKTATVSGYNIAARTSSAGYDSLGEFQTSATNALSQSQSWLYDPRFGVPTSHTDLNGLTATSAYDSFGRETLETRPDGNKTAVTYAYCSGVNGGSASCVGSGAFIATATPQNSGGAQNGPQSIAYYDSLGRSLASDVQGFDGSWIRTSTQYDAKGRVSNTSRPYFVSGGTIELSTYTYDTIGRATEVSLPKPNGGTVDYAYHGLTISATNDHGQTTTTTKNAQGLNAAVTDALNHTTNYVYDAQGNPLTVTDPSGNVMTNHYDVRGNKTTSSDPDMGSWSYGYDVLGELTSQTDAKSQTTTLNYDLLGRLTTRTESGQVSSWIYDIAVNGVGKLYEAKACGTVGCGTVFSDRTFSYDSLGRPSTTVTTVGGTASTYTSTYDSNGRPSTIAYPSGLTLQYAYTTLSYLSQIKDNSSGAAYWTASARDAEMHPLLQTFGNGVSQSNSYDPNTGFLLTERATKSVTGDVASFDFHYDTLGNLSYRHDDAGMGVSEFACYDQLNRLYQYATGTGSSVTACTSPTNNKIVGYDPLGNITAKTAVGSYNYNPAGAARPHAVASIAGTVNGVVNPSYTYDNNGNMTAGAGRTVSYTAFNMAALITQGTTSVALTYDDQHQRITQTLTSGSTTTTTTYLNDPASGAMSEKVVSGSATAWHDYVLADGHIIAEHTSTSGGGGPVWGTAQWGNFNWSSSAGAAPGWQYFVLDHLGSIAVVTDANGAVLERDAYDAWGKRRNLDGSDDTACSLTSDTTRGFTGHEHIDSECLINANARIYDPTIARFMSADTMVPDPYNGQAFNAYSYVNNSPLSMVDPSGHDSLSLDTACKIYHPYVPCQAMYTTGADECGQLCNQPSYTASMYEAAQKQYELEITQTVTLLQVKYADGTTGWIIEGQSGADGVAYTCSGSGTCQGSDGSTVPDMSTSVESVVVTGVRDTNSAKLLNWGDPNAKVSNDHSGQIGSFSWKTQTECSKAAGKCGLEIVIAPDPKLGPVIWSQQYERTGWDGQPPTPDCGYGGAGACPAPLPGMPPNSFWDVPDIYDFTNGSFRATTWARGADGSPLGFFQWGFDFSNGKLTPILPTGMGK